MPLLVQAVRAYGQTDFLGSQLCDQDGDGVISRSDLEGLLASLGALSPSEKRLRSGA